MATEERVKVVMILLIVITAVIVAWVTYPAPQPPPPTRKLPSAERVGESAGDTAHRFGSGFLRGWKGAKTTPTSHRNEQGE